MEKNKRLVVTSNNISAGQTRRQLYKNVFEGFKSTSYCLHRCLCSYNNKLWHFHRQRLCFPQSIINSGSRRAEVMTKREAKQTQTSWQQQKNPIPKKLCHLLEARGEAGYLRCPDYLAGTERRMSVRQRRGKNRAEVSVITGTGRDTVRR